MHTLVIQYCQLITVRVSDSIWEKERGRHLGCRRGAVSRWPTKEEKTIHSIIPKQKLKSIANCIPHVDLVFRKTQPTIIWNMSHPKSSVLFKSGNLYCVDKTNFCFSVCLFWLLCIFRMWWLCHGLIVLIHPSWMIGRWSRSIFVDCLVFCQLVNTHQSHLHTKHFACQSMTATKWPTPYY